jgi:hypothetical protein
MQESTLQLLEVVGQLKSIYPTTSLGFNLTLFYSLLATRISNGLSCNVQRRMLLLKLNEFCKMKHLFSVNTFIIGNALDDVREDEK